MRLRSWFCQTCSNDLSDQEYSAVVVCEKCGTQYYNGETLPESAVRFQVREVPYTQSKGMTYRLLLRIQLFLVAGVGPAFAVANILTPKKEFAYVIVATYVVGLILELCKKEDDISVRYALLYWLVVIIYLLVPYLAG